MTFIGDVHGRFQGYLDIIAGLEGESIQVGDFGLGFGREEPVEWDKRHRFIRGNHDRPKSCQKHPNYLGDYGVTDSGNFFVGGGFSIDYQWRQQHNVANPNQRVWWKDEEIAESRYQEIAGRYINQKPSIVVSHDCPAVIREQLFGGNADDKKTYKNRTSDLLLTTLFKKWQPDLWVFGHYHLSQTIQEGKTLFVCLNELEAYTVKEAANG